MTLSDFTKTIPTGEAMTEENTMDGIKDISVERLKWLSENMDRLTKLGNSGDPVISTLALYARGQILSEKLYGSLE